MVTLPAAAAGDHMLLLMAKPGPYSPAPGHEAVPLPGWSIAGSPGVPEAGGGCPSTGGSGGRMAAPVQIGRPFPLQDRSRKFWGNRFRGLYICRYRRISPYMGRLLFDLTDEDRALLEAHRVRLGLRSHAETLRALIRSGPVIVGIDLGHPDGDRSVEVTARMNAEGRFEVESFKEHPPARARSSPSDPELYRRPVLTEIPILARKTFNPQPKRGGKA